MFTQKSFGPISSHGNSDMPNIWTYTTTDTSAELLENDYFKAKHPIFNDGDLIYAQPSDTPIFGKLRKTADGFTIDPLVGPGSMVGNEIVITKVEDFDNFDENSITLTDGFTYNVHGHVDIGSRCMTYTGSVVLKASNTTSNSITSSCPSEMITGSGSYKLQGLTLISTVAPIYNITLSTSSIMILENFTHVGDMGSMTGFTGSALFADLGSFDSSQTPIMFKGDWTRIELDNVFPRGVAIDSGKSLVLFDQVNISERILIRSGFSDIASGGVAYKFNDISGIGNEAVQFANNKFTGEGLPIEGLDNDDNQLFSKANIGVADTLPNGAWRIEDNLSETVITATGVPVVINGTADEVSVERFLLQTSPNELTYTGARLRAFNATGTFVMETSLSNQRIGAQVFKNGIASPIVFTSTTSGSAGDRIENLSISGVLTLSENDTIDVRVLNQTSTDNITVLDAIFQLVAIN